MGTVLTIKRERWLPKLRPVLIHIFSRRQNKTAEISNTPDNPFPNQEKIFSVDKFELAPKKWGWGKTLQKYLIKEVLPLCPCCDTLMQYNGYPDKPACCLTCEQANRPHLYSMHQFSYYIFNQIAQRYSNGN